MNVLETLVAKKERLDLQRADVLALIRKMCHHPVATGRVVQRGYNEYEPDEYETYCPTCESVI